MLTTIHWFKGLERPFVCVVGLDAQWERTAADPMEMFCLYFVALTRATDKLLILVGDPPYAALRRTPLPPRASRGRSPRCQPVRHAPFAVLSVPMSMEPDGAIRLQVLDKRTAVDAARLDASRVLPGRGRSVEDAAPYMNNAVVYLVRQLLGVSLADVTEAIAQSRAPPAVKTWVRELDGAGLEISSGEVFRLAVVTHSAMTRYSHYWRQVVPREQLTGMLDACAKTAAALLQTLGLTFTAGAPWVTAVDKFSDTHEAAVEVQSPSAPDLVSTDGWCVVFLLTAPVLRHEVVLHAATVAALRSIDAGHPVRCVLLHTNAATLYEVESQLSPDDLVRRVARRKDEAL